MKKPYKVTLFTIFVILIILIACAIGYLNYDANDNWNDSAFVYVDGNLSFNFIEGNQIEITGEEKEYHFSVSNTSQDPYYYSITLENVSGGENGEFELISNREGFQNIKRKYPETDNQVANAIRINGNETHNYTFTLKNPDKNTIKGTITISLEKDMTTLANVILKNNVINVIPKTEVAQSIATEEEGLIETTDDFGPSYYFRGDVNNNYIVFAGLSWRIVRINGDGTVKLVLNELINTKTQFYTKDSGFNLSFPSANIYQELKTWYDTNLGTYDSFIANYKFCSDATYDEQGFSTPTRIYTNHSPILECLGTTDTLKIGLLTADEVAFAGANNTNQNNKFYLYNSAIKSGWWTISPSKNTNGSFSYIEISQNGLMNDGTIGTLFRGTRPVINLTKKTTVTGSGTPEDPYLVNYV